MSVQDFVWQVLVKKVAKRLVSLLVAWYAAHHVDAVASAIGIDVDWQKFELAMTGAFFALAEGGRNYLKNKAGLKWLVILLGLCAASSMAQDAILSLGPLDVYVPAKTMRLVGGYDFIENRALGGAETPLIKVWNIEGVIGGLTDKRGNGGFFAGGNIALPNPAEKVAPLADLKPGAFGGWDTKLGQPMVGFKIDKAIW